MATFALATLHMPAKIAFVATVVDGLCGVSFSLVSSGAVSDRIGRKPMMLIPGLVLLLSIVPAFHVISRYRTTATLLGATAILSTLAVLSACPMIIWITESLPASVRSGGLGIIYAISIATFGGTTQYVVIWLTKATGRPLAPAWYWTAAALMGSAAMSVTRESAPRKVAKPEFLSIKLADDIKQSES